MMITTIKQLKQNSLSFNLVNYPTHKLDVPLEVNHILIRIHHASNM